MMIRRRFSSTTDYAIASFSEQPRHILEKIVWHKEQEIAQRQIKLPLKQLQTQLKFAPPVRDFLLALKYSSRKPSLIAEVKQASPSQGLIRANFDPIEIALAYVRGGATCLSVLSDATFFGGSFEYLQAIRERVKLPLLCKEFIIEPYQIYLARSQGADAVLLIAAILSDQDLQYLIDLTHRLGMEALIEVHNAAECERLLFLSDVNLLGINNRNLEDFTVDLSTTEQLMQEYQEIFQQLGITVVSESGIHSSSDVKRVQKAGANAILVGESLMRQPDLEQAIQNLYDLVSPIQK